MNSKLSELADACYNGACNPQGIINSLSEAIKEIAPGRCRDSAELKVIVGQISFLLGESLGPTEQALNAYRELKDL
jgi:hypothetical protein